MASLTEERTVFTFTTTDMNLVCTLLCFDGIFLNGTKAQPLPDSLQIQGRRPRCTFTIGSQENGLLLEKLKQHKDTTNGADVPSKRYDEIRKYIVIPAMNEAQAKLKD